MCIIAYTLPRFCGVPAHTVCSQTDGVAGMLRCVCRPGVIRQMPVGQQTAART
jgi:hypothetical protein